LSSWRTVIFFVAWSVTSRKEHFLCVIGLSVRPVFRIFLMFVSHLWTSIQKKKRGTNGNKASTNNKAHCSVHISLKFAVDFYTYIKKYLVTLVILSFNSWYCWRYLRTVVNQLMICNPTIEKKPDHPLEKDLPQLVHVCLFEMCIYPCFYFSMDLSRCWKEFFEYFVNLYVQVTGLNEFKFESSKHRVSSLIEDLLEITAF